MEKKSIIIRGFDQAHLEEFVPSLIERFEVEKIFWITNFHTVIPDKYIHMIEIVDFKLDRYIDENVDINTQENFDVEILTSLKETESYVMTMFERSYNFYNSYVEKRALYIKYVYFWNDLIKKNNIEFALFDILPHAPYDYTLYGVCKFHEVPFLFFDNIKPGYVFLWDDWKKSPIGLYNNSIDIKGIDNYSLSKEGLKIWDSLYLGNAEPAPYYMNKKFRRSYNFKNRIKKLKRFWLQINSYKKLKKVLIAKNIISYNEKMYFNTIWKWQKTYFLNRALKKYSLKELPDKGEKFIYVALHLQPEVSTGPRAGVFIDQLIMIRMLSKSIPGDVKIIIKENPYQKFLFRSIDFFKEVTSLNNVSLVSKDVSTYELIENSICSVTCTGTVGWESLFKKKPVIAFGYPFYQFAPNILMVQNQNDLNAALKKILCEEINIREKDIKNYLKAIDKTIISANLDGQRQLINPIDPSKCVDNLISSVEDYFNN